MAILLLARLENRKKGVWLFMAKKKPIDLQNLEPEEQLKYEIAEELGLLNKVMSDGWKSLSAKETGRIGGLMTKKKKELKEKIQKEGAQEEDLLEELL